MTDLLEAVLGPSAAQVLACDELCLAASASLEEQARYLALNLGQRESFVTELEGQYDLWDALGNLWAELADSLHPKTGSAGSSEDSQIALALALAKFERNLVAGLADYQDAAFTDEPAIRELIFNITTFSRIEDSRYASLHSVITQLLSNLISPIGSDQAGEAIVNEKLEIYLRGKREDDIVIRLLDSKDAKTNSATLRLLANVVRGSVARQQLILQTDGIKWMTKILSQMDEWHLLSDGRFELGVSLFDHFLDSALQPILAKHLADASEPITPLQTTFLKLLDSHLALPSRSNDSPSPHKVLVEQFKDLARYSLISFQSGVDDARLPKVLEGLMLVTEGLCSIGLTAQSRRDRGTNSQAGADAGGDEETVATMRSGPEGIIKSLIDLLRQLDLFLPGLTPAKARSAPPSALTPEQKAPFAAIKRNLVRLLGVLTFENPDAGDQVREADGIHLVLSLTEIDEGNPYLREHALFAVRNLTANNPANQAVIKEMDPVGVISETGEVLPLPEKLKRQQSRA